MKEIIGIYVGGAGCRLGTAFSDLLCQEHGIGKDGSRSNAPDDLAGSFFDEAGGKWTPRALFVDLDPTTINAIRQGDQQQLFDPEYLLSAKESAAGNFARGHYTIGREILDSVVDKINKLANRCTNLQGFIVVMGVGGGTGSGLGTSILEHLAEHHGEKTKVVFAIYPGADWRSPLTAPYNAILATSRLNDHAEACLVLDNEVVYNDCQQKLSIKHPSYDSLNETMAQAMSDMMTQMDFADSQANLASSARLKFLTLDFEWVPRPNELPDWKLGSVVQNDHQTNVNEVLRLFRERILDKYDLLYSQRAYVHWYVGEGMDEGELAEARENIGFLERDYLEAAG